MLIGIEDNGKGFDTQNATGNGLNTIKNRSKDIEARLQLVSLLNQGSNVYIEVLI